MNDRSG